jgi:hypothetical protein
MGLIRVCFEQSQMACGDSNRAKGQTTNLKFAHLSSLIDRSIAKLDRNHGMFIQWSQS